MLTRKTIPELCFILASASSSFVMAQQSSATDALEPTAEQETAVLVAENSTIREENTADVTNNAVTAPIIKVKYRGASKLISIATQYYVEYCPDKACQTPLELTQKEKQAFSVNVAQEAAKQVRNFFYRQGAHSIRYPGVMMTTKKEMLSFLRKSFAGTNDGDGPISSQQAIEVDEYIERFGADSISIYQMNMELDFADGTAMVTSFILNNTKSNWVNVINKLTYVE